jgi:hypothetical protein
MARHYLNIVFIGVLLLCAQCDTAQNVAPIFDRVVVKFIGGNGNQSAADVVVHPAGGFVILGTTWELNSEEISVESALLVRINEVGNILWEQRISGNQWVKGNSLAVDAQGNVIVGATTFTEEGRRYLMMAKYSEAGSLIAGPVIFDNLSEYEPGSGLEERTSLDIEGSHVLIVENDPDFNGYYFSGTGVYPDGTSDFYCLKTLPDLSPDLDESKWRMRNGFEGVDRGVGALVFEGKLIVFGDVAQVGGNRDFYYYAFNADGLPANVSRPPKAGSQEAEQAAFGYGEAELVFIGTQAGAGQQIYLELLESNAVTPRQINYPSPGNLVGRSITASEPGKYVVLGEQITATNRNIYLSKFFNNTGMAQIEWERVYGGAEMDEAKKVISLADGGLAIVGTFRVGRQTKIGFLRVNKDGLFMP